MPLKPTKRGYKVWFKSWFEIRLRIPIWSTPGKKTRVQVVLVSASVSSKLLQNHSSLPTSMSLWIISSRPWCYWITCVPRTYLKPVQFVQIAVICQWWPGWTTQWHVVKPNGARETVSAMWSGRIPRWYMWCPQHSVRTPCWMQSAQKDGTSVLVDCPQSVLEYTKCMGGVDRFDRSRGHYSVSHNAIRWWVRIFYFLIDSAAVNAFILFQSVHPEKPTTAMTFRVDLFREMVCGQSFQRRTSSLEGSSFMKYRLSGQKRVKMMGVPDNIRLHQGNHFPSRSKHFVTVASAAPERITNVHGSFADSAMSHFVLHHASACFTSNDCCEISDVHWLL